MTTAHKPTWQPARGAESGTNLSVPTRSYSSRDLPGHLHLKVREDGQSNRNDLKYKDFKAELLEKEKKYFREKNEKQGIFTVEDDKKDSIAYKEPAQRKKIKTNQTDLINQLQQYGSDDEDIKNKPIKDVDNNDGNASDNSDDKSISSSSSSEIDEEALKKKSEQSMNPFPQDADDLDFANTSSESDKQSNNNDEESSENDSDSDDDEELLMREYQKIKEQREAEDKDKQRIKQEEVEKQRQSNLLTHNPLLEQNQYSLKKKWFEDSVFKNQSKRDKEEKVRFINDNVRSDFHRKFLKKFI